MYLLAFHGFLRIGEIVVSSARNSSVVLQVNQVTVNQTECVIVFHSYKHYQGHPVSLVISPGADVDFCPLFVTPCPFEKTEMTPCPFD